MYTYIIVDDEMIIRQGFIAKVHQVPSLSLECAGEAANGAEALALIEKAAPDIVVTDMKMSGMDGIELLKQLNERYPQIPVIVISGYKLFDYVKQAIEKHAVGYVLKPFSAEEIGEQLQKAIEQLESRNRILRLQQEITYFEQKEKQDVFLNVVLHPWSEAMAAPFRSNGEIKDWEYQLLTVTTEQPDFTRRLETLCSDQLAPSLYSLMENPLDRQQNLLLLHCSRGRNDLQKTADRIANSISGLAQEDRVVICVSRVVREPAELHRIYQENGLLLERVYLTDRVRVLRAEDSAQKEALFTEEDIRSRFLEMRYHTGKIADLLNDFFECFDLEKCSLGEMADACENLLEKVNEYASQNQVEVTVPSEKFCRKYLFCRNQDRIQGDLTDYIHTTLNAVHMKETDQENLIHQMKEYIEKNYRKKLTLQMIASRFYISPACCSSLLKENLNMTFNDYLSDIRINNAKKLLSETNLSVNKISNEVGYSNPKYFFKIFKVYSGFTPLEYRTLKSGT